MRKEDEMRNGMRNPGGLGLCAMCFGELFAGNISRHTPPEHGPGHMLCAECYGDTPAARLEYLRGELRAERISYGELAELQAWAEFIPADDLELREAAGLPEAGTVVSSALYALLKEAGHLDGVEPADGLDLVKLHAEHDLQREAGHA